MLSLFSLVGQAQLVPELCPEAHRSGRVAVQTQQRSRGGGMPHVPRQDVPECGVHFSWGDRHTLTTCGVGPLAQAAKKGDKTMAAANGLVRNSALRAVLQEVSSMQGVSAPCEDANPVCGHCCQVWAACVEPGYTPCP